MKNHYQMFLIYYSSKVQNLKREGNGRKFTNKTTLIFSLYIVVRKGT